MAEKPEQHYTCKHCGEPIGEIVRGAADQDRLERLVIDTDKYPGLIIRLEVGEVEHKADGSKRFWTPTERGYQRLMERINRRKNKV